MRGSVQLTLRFRAAIPNQRQPGVRWISLFRAVALTRMKATQWRWPLSSTTMTASLFSRNNAVTLCLVCGCPAYKYARKHQNPPPITTATASATMTRRPRTPTPNTTIPNRTRAKLSQGPTALGTASTRALCHCALTLRRPYLRHPRLRSTGKTRPLV